MDLNWWKNFLFSVLPNSPLFNGIKERSFTKLVYSLGTAPKEAHDYNGQNITDIHPSTTTRDDEWSDQFGYPTTQTESRLLAEWAQVPFQSPNGLQQALNDAGYANLYVHEWWVPGSSPVTARNPIPYINNFPPNNLLVNWQAYTYNDVPQCGDDIQCGDTVGGEVIHCGMSYGIFFEEKIYPHASNPDEYPFYFYVGGETWPDPASLTSEEVSDVKRIIYKHKPVQQRCVLLANADVWVNTPTSGDEIWVNTPTTGPEIYINGVQ